MYKYGKKSYKDEKKKTTVKRICWIKKKQIFNWPRKSCMEIDEEN